MSLPYRKMELSRKKKKAFLTALILNGGLAEPAAREVGYTSTSYLRACAKQDEEFKEAWDEAIEAAGDLIEAEVYRRAVHGVMEPVFYQGNIVGYVRKYSDRLAELLLKRHKPEYRDTNQGGNVNVNVGIAVMPARAVNADEWESRAIEMHEGQDVIVLEDKPKENKMVKTLINRSD